MMPRMAPVKNAAIHTLQAMIENLVKYSSHFLIFILLNIAKSKWKNIIPSAKYPRPEWMPNLIVPAVWNMNDVPIASQTKPRINTRIIHVNNFFMDRSVHTATLYKIRAATIKELLIVICFSILFDDVFYI